LVTKQTQENSDEESKARSKEARVDHTSSAAYNTVDTGCEK
jgi:hypothetical protein